MTLQQQRGIDSRVQGGGAALESILREQAGAELFQAQVKLEVVD